MLLITGVPGWLGNRMLEILANGDRYEHNAVNRKIRVLVEPRLKNAVFLPPLCQIFYGDITDKESLLAPLENVKTVYHLAGVVYPPNISDYYRVNVNGTKNLVDACITQGVKRFLFMSSDSICGFTRRGKIFSDNEASRPYKDYGKSKYLGEEYLFDKSRKGLIEATSLRGFWFFGPGMPERNIRFLQMFSWPRQVVFGTGKNIRSISHIDDITQAFIKAEKQRSTIGKWYWIGSEKDGYTVDEIYMNIADALGKAYKPFYIPSLVCELISLLDTFLGFFGKVNSFIHAAGKFHRNIAGSSGAAARDFNYKPTVEFGQIKQEIQNIMLNRNKNIKDQQFLNASKLQVSGLNR